MQTKQTYSKEELLHIFDQQEIQLKRIFEVTSRSISTTSFHDNHTSSITINKANNIKKTNEKIQSKEQKRYWTEEEHDKFLICLCFLNAITCKGLPVIQIAQYIKTRTSVQVRTHAQKYFSDKKKIVHSQQRIVSLMKEDIQTLQLLFGKKKPIMYYKNSKSSLCN